MYQTKDICHQYYVLCGNIGLHDIENHCGKVINQSKLDLSQVTLCEISLTPRLYENKSLRLSQKLD